MIVYPSKGMWVYCNRGGGTITDLGISSSIADMLAGYHISHTAKEVLRDLSFLNKKGMPNERAKDFLALHLHGLFHRGKSDVTVLDPTKQEVVCD